MNLNNDPNFSEKINSQPCQTSQHQSEQPIDAEIIAEIETDPSEINQEDENIINLTCYAFLEEEKDPHNPRDPLPSWIQQVLTPVSTPWGLGALSLILGANLGIAGVQFWKIYQPPRQEVSLTVIPDSSSPNLSIPKSLDLARKSPNHLMLEALSTVSNSSVSQPSPHKMASTSVSVQPKTPNVVNVNQPLSLTNAILPPSLQPQTPSNYGMSLTPLQVPQVPKTITPPPPPISVANIPRPFPPSVPPSTVPSVTIQPPSPPVGNGTVSEDEQVRQSVKQQLNIEENNSSDIPLGFNHKTRLELQNGLNKVSPELLPQQIKRLEQLQQREVLDSAH